MRQGKKKHPASRLARFLLFFCQSQLAGLIVAHLRNPRLFSHQPLRAHGFGRTLFAGWCTYAHGILITLVIPARQYFRVLSSLETMNMVKTFTIIEKQVYKKVTHFGGQISKDSEVFLRRYTSPFRSGFERGQPQDYAANLQFAS
jgi:hypothetical protein